MQNLKVRPFKEKDLLGILKLEEECFKSPYSRELLEREVILPISKILVAEEGDSLVGYIFGWVVFEVCEINRLAVKTKMRRRGIGRALLKNFLELIKGEGVKEVFLEVRDTNLPALKLYRSVGFKQVGIRKGYYGKEDALILKLNLGGKDAQG